MYVTRPIVAESFIALFVRAGLNYSARFCSRNRFSLFLLSCAALLAPWTAPRVLADTYPAIGVWFDGRTQNASSDPSVQLTLPAIWGPTVAATHVVWRDRATQTLNLIVGRLVTSGAFPTCTGPDGKVYNHPYLIVGYQYPHAVYGDGNALLYLSCEGSTPWGWQVTISPGPTYNVYTPPCPGGGTYSPSPDGTDHASCINALPCAAGEMRNVWTGKCGPSILAKNVGARCDLTANPCNTGTGTKFQVEAVYRASSNSPLVEQLSYNSRPLSDAVQIWKGAYGTGWKGNYDRQINNLNWVVVAQRQDGRELNFRAPASGNLYVADADVADRVERLVDGTGNIIGWKLTVAADDSIELYDASGRLLSITDRAGATTTLGYSTSSTPSSIAPTSGLLISVSDPWGRTLSYVYDINRRVIRLTDPANDAYNFAYDSAGNLASITFPDSRIRQFVYNEQEHTQNTALPNALTGIIDENGARFATYEYDTQGRAVTSEHAGSTQRYTFVYTAPNSVTTVTDPLGVARDYGLTTSLGVVRRTGVSGAACPSCGSAAQMYDANGNVSSRTDWNGNRTNYAYDLTRNLETSRTEGLTSSGGTTPQTRTITWAWHASFRLPTQVAEPLRITTNVYDSDGTACGARGALCSRTVQATYDANGSQGLSATPVGTPRVWTYTYNANGSVLSVNGPRTDAADVTTYTYYPNDDPDPGKRGNVATIVNALGHTTSITAYNAQGQPLTIVDPNGLTTTLTYDSRQRLTSRSVGSEVTFYDYDGVGQVATVTLPDGSFLTYGYDSAHRLTSITDSQGNRIAYTLDAMGNRTAEQVFDPANTLAQTRTRVFSNLNRLFQELGSLNQTTEYGYDSQGNVTSVKDPLNRVTSNQYDALNRLKQVTDPGLGATQYAYNGLDALIQVSDPRALVTGYTVNGLGNLTSQTSPDTGNTSSTYDAAGNVLTRTDAKGQTTTYAYDALNRITLITFYDGSKQAYAYDSAQNGIGRLASITETDSANQQTNLIQYSYSLQGRVSSETRTVGGVQYVVAYSYDSAGRLSGMTYPSGRTVAYGFDSLGRVNVINTTFNGQTMPVVAAITYHPFGGVKSYVLGNGQGYSRSYDQDGRVNSYSLGAKTFLIGYDAASRIEFTSESGNPLNINNYGYDSLDRLTSAVTPGTPYGYSYDAVGNRLSKTAGAGTDTLAYSSTSNRIDTLTPASGPIRSFVFDANGSTTNDGVNTYAYDVRGRMVQATSVIGATNYQVNALGQRIRKTNSQGDTVFHYDLGGRLIAETDPAGVRKREVMYLGDIPVAVVQ